DEHDAVRNARRVDHQLLHLGRALGGVDQRADVGAELLAARRHVPGELVLPAVHGERPPPPLGPRALRPARRAHLVRAWPAGPPPSVGRRAASTGARRSARTGPRRAPPCGARSPCRGCRAGVPRPASALARSAALAAPTWSARAEWAARRPASTAA